MRCTERKVSNFCHPLASTLANNHLYCSLSKSQLKQVNKSGFKGILRSDIYDPKYKRRVVALVGAGASYEGNLNLADEVVKNIRKDLLLRNEKFLLEEVDRQAEKISKTHGWEIDKFETQLNAFTKVELGAQVMREKLTEYFGYRYRPLLAYEIIAHLLKHRFLDAVINYNFDELLDQSIADELHSEEYDYVLSDGDLDPACVKTTKTLERPVYIKPHGSVSHPATLRYTHDAYYEIPEAITGLITNLFTQKALDLIVFGFSLKSPEVQDLILRCKSKSVRVFLVDIKDWKIPKNLEKKVSAVHLIKPDKHFNRSKNDYGIKYFDEHNKPSLLFAELWRRVTQTFVKQYQPRGITRHEVVSRLFYVASKKKSGLNTPIAIDEPDVDPIDYLWSRTVVEVTLAIARGRGFISIPHLMRDRAGNYYREYIRRNELLKADNDHKVPMTLVEICKNLGMVKKSYSDVIMTFGSREPDRLLVSRKERDEFIDMLVEKLFGSSLKLPRWLYGRLGGKKSKELTVFKNSLMDLYSDGDVEIRLDIPEIYKAQINQFAYLGSRTAIKYATYGILKNDSYPYVRIVSEVGEWLLKDPIVRRCLHRKKGIQIIIADKNNQSEIEKVFRKKVEVRHMDWWMHNRHMTLAFKGEPDTSKERDKCERNCVGIFWNRRLRTPDLRPILLSASNTIDAQLAFNLYWSKAGSV